ncbi:hypothetical protein SAMN06265339_0766 [Desulfurobacterium pacificum]|uniref:Restriction endonuclease n=1 Tax=Desulfurobacterium pacificum TaxID=240166 RepID=A0ABY1NI22_9BACT|nr:hypothetical protein [Desulfurobacterium pacificum]SMP10281.1 hypothetical protein SAMN06265339_0766 [Desulfurobacterium pacificum]
MEIQAVIENIKYEKCIRNPLKKFSFPSFEIDINELPPTCLINIKNFSFAISKWVSPKRTRSYPYARVYDTLQTPASKVVAIIPIIKDEGRNGDRDFLQWDTVSLMSLLNVYVIPAYYSHASRKVTKSGKIKISNQQFDGNYITRKLKELSVYHASALHWNLKELSPENLTKVINKALLSYKKISEITGVPIHSVSGIEKFQRTLSIGIKAFKDFSRFKAQRAQKREKQTIQPKEKIQSGKKGTITIKNYLGGYYFFTVDEVAIKSDALHLIEAKHSSSKLLPSKEDIKDGLLKMIIYTNLSEAFIGKEKVKKVVPVLKLTSKLIRGKYISSDILKVKSDSFLKALIEESNKNSFEIWLEGIHD